MTQKKDEQPRDPKGAPEVVFPGRQRGDDTRNDTPGEPRDEGPADRKPEASRYVPPTGAQQVAKGRAIRAPSCRR